MQKIKYSLLFVSLLLMPHLSMAALEKGNALDQLNPFDPNIEEILENIDEQYRQETGRSPFMEESIIRKLMEGIEPSCVRNECKVWLQVVRSQQRAYLHINGTLHSSWLVSTGARGYDTPNFDKHPNGRIYDYYESSKYPGGDYKGLGNMPYAVFIEGGFAVHGTIKRNWPNLGTRVSHGCVRMHPDQAYLFNRLVRENGIDNVWITVQE